MNVRTVCLSILYGEDASGYEIRRRCVEGECAYFVEASFGSIYPALAKLETEKLVTSRVEQQDGKPAKKVYSITEAGCAEFKRALLEPLGEEVFRSPILLFTRFSYLLPADLVEARLQEYLAQIIERRRKLESLLTGTDSNACDTWVSNYGLVMMTTAENHIRTHMQDLIKLAQGNPAHRDAAE